LRTPTAYAKFTRIALNTNDIDMRARPHSAEEEQFPSPPGSPGAPSRSATPTWKPAPAVLLAGFEPEDESPIVFLLRLRKAARKDNLAVFSVAAVATPGLEKVLRHAAADRAGRRAGRADRAPRRAAAADDADIARAAELLAKPGSVILAGRAARRRCREHSASGHTRLADEPCGAKTGTGYTEAGRGARGAVEVRVDRCLDCLPIGPLGRRPQGQTRKWP